MVEAAEEVDRLPKCPRRRSGDRSGPTMEHEVPRGAGVDGAWVALVMGMMEFGWMELLEGCVVARRVACVGSTREL